MEYYQPQIHLFYKTVEDDSGSFVKHYSLHTITNCEITNFRAMGNNPLPSGLDDQNSFQIDLLIEQDFDLPHIFVDTPVVHTLDLGPLPSEEGDIKVNVVLEGGRGVGSQIVGSKTVKPTDADEDSRPIR